MGEFNKVRTVEIAVERPRDGHAPSAPWLLSLIWQTLAKRSHEQNAGASERADHSRAWNGGGWVRIRSDIYLNTYAFIVIRNGIGRLHSANQKNPVRLGASLGNLFGLRLAQGPSRSRASTPHRKARRSTTQRLEA